MLNKITQNMRLVTLAVMLAVTSAVAWPFAASNYASTSKLSTGTWVKIAVSESGIYQITSDDASSWGLGDVSSLHVFGYGGAPLKEYFTEDMPDDLPQIPVVRENGRILFYAQGPVTWTSQSSDIPFRQVQNPYSTLGYYFVTNDSRFSDVEIEKSSMTVMGTPATTATGRTYHEEEIYNPGQTGRVFLGEDFSSTKSQSFDFTLPGYVAGTNVRVLTNMAAKSSSASTISTTANGTALSGTATMRGTTSGYDHYTTTVSNNVALSTQSFTLDGTNSLTYGVTFNPTGTIYLARLDYITVNYERTLALDGGYLSWGDRNGKLGTSYQLSGCSDATQVWDVTQPQAPVLMNTTASGSTLTFSPSASGYREYIAFNTTGTSYPHPTLSSKLSNQDLHGEATPDMIIITPSEYETQAKRVASLHEDEGMRVLVTTDKLVYNEFSSGTPDVMAYRRLCKMFWDRGADSTGHKLGYLLLFGNGSYDNRGLMSTSGSYPKLLTWQSEASNNENGSYTTDDCLAIMSDNASADFQYYDLDIAVGRMPVKSVSEATTAVDKLVKYVNGNDYGVWKTNTVNVADDEDAAIHMKQAQKVIEKSRQWGGNDIFYNYVFIDAFTAVSSGGSRTYPDARTKMFSRLTEGAIWWNYTGHASPMGWTGEGLMRISDVTENLYYKHLPVLYAATCEYTRYDADAQSGGEGIFLNANGGAISVICPPRLVYISDNGPLNESVAKYIFSPDDSGQPRRVGDILRLGKNDTLRTANKLRYFMFGDPAMRLAVPTHRVVVETINGKAVGEGNLPQIEARQTIKFTGSIVDRKGNAATDFNGAVISTLYDSETDITTNGYGTNGVQFTYSDRPNKLAITVDTVKAGKFEVSIVVPSELASYETITTALVNMYAYDRTSGIEAMGSNTDFYLVGYDESVKQDTIGPDIVYLGLNSATFEDGGAVNESPLVLAEVADESGVNFSTGGIGHAMTLTLDKTTTYSDLSSYYTPLQAETGTRGTISYQLNDLATGAHTLTLKVWDVFNNSSSKTINFNVVNGLKPEITDVYAVGNPASVETRFYVKHNRPDAVMTVTIEVWDIMGREVWSTTTTGRSNEFTTVPVTWSLVDNTGNRVPNGIYVYRATISTDGVREATKAKKLAVVSQ